MDGVTPVALLSAAHDAGLTVTAAGALLIVRGPRRAAELARALLARKGDVLPLVRVDADLPGLVLHLAAELDWPRVRTVTGQDVGPGADDWRRVVSSPRLTEPARGLLLGGLKGALARRLAGVPQGVSWHDWHNDGRATAAGRSLSVVLAENDTTPPLPPKDANGLTPTIAASPSGKRISVSAVARVGDCDTPDCPRPGIPTEDGHHHCAEHHLEWVRAPAPAGESGQV